MGDWRGRLQQTAEDGLVLVDRQGTVLVSLNALLAGYDGEIQVSSAEGQTCAWIVFQKWKGERNP